MLGLVVGGLLGFRWGAWNAAVVICCLTLLVGGIGLVRPNWVRPLYVTWMLAFFPLGWLVAHVLLVAIFYLVITPIGLMMRLCGRDPLARRFDESKSSYWIVREKDQRDHSRYFRPF